MANKAYRRLEENDQDIEHAFSLIFSAEPAEADLYSQTQLYQRIWRTQERDTAINLVKSQSLTL